MVALLPRIKKKISQVLTDFVYNEDASIAKHKVVMASGLLAGVTFAEDVFSSYNAHVCHSYETSDDYPCNDYGTNKLVHSYPPGYNAEMSYNISDTDGCINNITALTIKAGHHNVSVCDCYGFGSCMCEVTTCGCNEVCTSVTHPCSCDGDTCDCDRDCGTFHKDCDSQFVCRPECSSDTCNCDGVCDGNCGCHVEDCNCEDQCTCKSDCGCDKVCSCDNVCSCDED